MWRFQQKTWGFIDLVSSKSMSPQYSHQERLMKTDEIPRVPWFPVDINYSVCALWSFPTERHFGPKKFWVSALKHRTLMLDTRFGVVKLYGSKLMTLIKCWQNYSVFPAPNAHPERLAADSWERWCLKERSAFHPYIYIYICIICWGTKQFSSRAISSIDFPMWQ